MAADNKLSTTELLYRSAKSIGLKPSWITPGGLFAITTPEGRDLYINFTRSPLNTHLGTSLAKDKYLTRLIMQRKGLPNIPFARPKTLAHAQAFLEAHGTIIVKPVKGLGAQDIHIVTSIDEIRQLRFTKYIFEKYIVGKEMRYLILNNQVISVHESEYGTSVAHDRALRRISYPRTEWDPLLMEQSLRISAILGLRFAAVDYLVDAHGHAHILEVNSAPGFKWFHAPTSGPAVDVAGMFLQSLLTHPEAATPASAITLHPHTASPALAL